MRSLLVLAAVAAALVVAAKDGERRIGWWWIAPDAANHPDVDAALAWLAANSDIVQDLFVGNCGVTTSHGSVQGTVGPACARVITNATALGVTHIELWGQARGDTVAGAEQLLGDPAGAASAIVAALAPFGGNLSGFNFDLEIGRVQMCTVNGHTGRCDEKYASFLSRVRDALRPHGYTVSVDVGCGKGWAPMIDNCAVLAPVVDKIRDMGTYHAQSFASWRDNLLAPLLSNVSLDKVAAGLACYNNSKSFPYELSDEGAAQRVCALLNRSVTSIDMFSLDPQKGFPMPFWLPHLRRFRQGGDCPMPE